jgi:hypothetical protein
MTLNVTLDVKYQKETPLMATTNASVVNFHNQYGNAAGSCLHLFLRRASLCVIPARAARKVLYER